MKTKIQAFGEGLRINAEGKYREDVLKNIQKLHLSSSFFSLDEILITPRFLAPPPITDPDSPPPYEEVLSTLIPYTPDWPQMASAYNSKTLSVMDVLQHTGNIAIIGNPGIGKTTTMAYIADCLSRQLLEAGELQEYLPVYLHNADLVKFDQAEENPISIIINSLSSQIPSLPLSRLSELLESFFKQGKAVLLFDGMDETYADEMASSIDFIKSILSNYPDIKIIVAASPNNLSEIPKFGFYLFSLAAWDPKSQTRFIQTWSHLWTQFIESPGRRWDDIKINPFLINGWMLNLESAVTPLDLTLKVWAAYAGDALGPRSIDAIEAYIRRMSVRVPKSRSTLDLLASIISLKMESTFLENEAKKWLLEGKKEAEIGKKDSENISDELEGTPILDIDPDAIPGLLDSGLLIRCASNKVRFVHPVIYAYLAGSTLPPDERISILDQPQSAMKDCLSNYLSYHSDLDKFILKSLSGIKDPLLRDRLIIGHWLPNIPPDAPIQKAILSQIAKDIQNEMLPPGLKMRLFTALTISRNPMILSLFRQFLNSDSGYLHQLAVLGCGYLRDLQSMGDLVKKLKDYSNVGQAACFALVNIGTKPALEAATSALLSGEERLARAAAEAFAANVKEGYPILKDGSKIDDILVRRATIYGLRKVNEPWAKDILEEMQIEDSQWIIKDAAGQAIEDISNPDPAIPKSQPPIEDLPWLIAFAGERGVGISAGKPALDMLLRVLKEGKEEEVLAALDQIKVRGETNIFPHIYSFYYGENPILKETAYNLLWQTASMGIEIPSLDQVGLIE